MHKQNNEDLIVKLGKPQYQTLQTLLAFAEEQDGKQMSVNALCREAVENKPYNSPWSGKEFVTYALYVLDSSEKELLQTSQEHLDDNKYRDIRFDRYQGVRYDYHRKVLGKKWVLHNIPIPDGDIEDRTWDLSGTVGASQILFSMALCYLLETRLSDHLRNDKLLVKEKKGKDLSDEYFLDFYIVKCVLYRTVGCSKGKCYVARCQVLLDSKVYCREEVVDIDDITYSPDYTPTLEEMKYAYYLERSCEYPHITREQSDRLFDREVRGLNSEDISRDEGRDNSNAQALSSQDEIIDRKQ